MEQCDDCHGWKADYVLQGADHSVVHLCKCGEETVKEEQLPCSQCGKYHQWEHTDAVEHSMSHSAGRYLELKSGTYHCGECGHRFTLSFEEKEFARTICPNCETYYEVGGGIVD